MKGFIQLTQIPGGKDALGAPQLMLVRADNVSAVLHIPKEGAWPDRTRIDFGRDARVVVESYSEVVALLDAALLELRSAPRDREQEVEASLTSV